MDFDRYQTEAQGTDRVPSPVKGDGDLSIIVPLRGLAGEAGRLLSEYKKFLRDGRAHKLFKQHVGEELGDILWYVANIAQKFDLRLGDIAEWNLGTIKDRWETVSSQSLQLFPQAYDYDSSFPPTERFSRQMEVELRVVVKDGKEVEVAPLVRTDFLLG